MKNNLPILDKKSSEKSGNESKGSPGQINTKKK
jgi:hypothetical protein